MRRSDVSEFVQFPFLTLAGKVSRAKAPEHTFKEAEYLKDLASARRRIRVRMGDNQEFEGYVEFFDAGFIRLTREDGPNLFLYKQDMKYLIELQPGPKSEQLPVPERTPPPAPPPKDSASNSKNKN